MQEEEREVVTPGEVLGRASELKAGKGTYVSPQNHTVYASLTGFRRILSPPPDSSDQRHTVEVTGHKAHGPVPEPGSVVIARVTKVMARMASVDIMCVGTKSVREKFSGIVRQQDVRATEIDKVDMHLSFRPGDIIRAVVLSLGDARAYYLSTAQNELGVISAESSAGEAMKPISWTEMQCPLTGQIEQRKVAKVIWLDGVGGCRQGEVMGSETTLPYLSPELNGEKLLVGANFASAGVGILYDTGIQFANIIRMFSQLQFFEQYQERVAIHFGAEQATQLVNEALVLITVGGNDFVNNYYLVPFSARSLQFSLPDYVTYLLSEYKKILMRLYELGVRRVLVTGTGPLGCVPAELAIRGSNGQCVADLQRAAQLFNPKLVDMIKECNSEVGSDIFIAANTALTNRDFISDPVAYGFITSKVACCGQGPYNGLGLCTALSNLCPNRDEYVFWDAFHPTEKANRIVVQQILSGNTEYMYPMNLSTILALDSKT